MFCPRCGRPVSTTANFCGGCGLPRAEIEKAAQPQPSPAQSGPEAPAVDINELNTTLSQLEGELTGINPVENYTTDTATNTNTEMAPQADIVEEIRLSVESRAVEQPAMEEASDSYQSAFSRNAPQHPYYRQAEVSQPVPQPVQQPAAPQEQSQNLSTVDFVWMMLISSIPVVGLFYVIYMAFVQKENTNKQSWARATMIVYAFGALLGLVFSMGILMTQFMYW